MQSLRGGVSMSEQTRIARAIKLELSRRGLKRTEFEKLTRLSRSTIDKALAGQFSTGTLARIETVLQKSFAARHQSAGDRARPEWVGYLRSSAEPYIGRYLCVHADFSVMAKICTYPMTLDWDEKIGGLTFLERGRRDQPYVGQVWMPPQLPYLYFVGATGDGRLRAAIVSHLDENQQMRGILTTLLDPTRNAGYKPAATPVVYLKVESYDSERLPEVTPPDPEYRRFFKLLNDTARSAVVLVNSPPPPEGVTELAI